MHPSEHIRNKFPNTVAGHHLEGCIVVWQEVKHVTKRDQLCVVVWHNDFKADDEHIKLHAVKRYFRVTEEGDPGMSVGGEKDAAPIPLPEAVDDAINGTSEEANTIKALRGVVDIDDDNEPAPKNVRATADNSNRLLSTEWGHDGFCFRRSQNFGSTQAKSSFSVDATSHGCYVQLFEGFFPKQLLLNVINFVNEKMDGDEEVVYGEFIWRIGMGVDVNSGWCGSALVLVNQKCRCF